MKKKIDSPLEKLTMLMVLPLITLVFYAFAKPEYSEPSASQSENVSMAAKKGKVYGKVTSVDGNFLLAATVVIKGTTEGTVTDVFGNYMLKSVPADAELVFSYVGLKTVQIKPVFDQPVNVKMDIAVIGLQKIVVSPEPESTILSVTSDEFGITIKGIIDNNPPLYVLDGRVIERSEFNKIGADNIETISVLKDSSELNKYGDKAKNGVLIITSKKIVPAPSAFSLTDIKLPGTEVRKQKKPAFTAVEQMPQFPGGEKRMTYYFSEYTKYPKQAKADKKEGVVLVSFAVGKNGSVEKVKILKGAYPALDDEAVRIVRSMPYWTPGKQNGNPVEVYYTIPVEFSLAATN